MCIRDRYYYLLIVKAMFITPNEDPIGNFRTATPMRISLLVCVAGIFVLDVYKRQLNYSFLGAVQLLIYAGGITVLYVFSILLTS